MDQVSNKLGTYYTACFAEHGATARGVDWHDAESLARHYDKMLDVIDPALTVGRVSLLDIGCGYGGLLDHARHRSIEIDYTGIDLVEASTEHGNTTHANAHFVAGDVFSFEPNRRFDYVVANGVLTEKLDVAIPAFVQFSRRIIRRMFDLCDHGIAFNMMSSYVNFMADNLFYQNPGELISFCATELSRKWRIDHAYPHYDFTMYVYR